MNNPTAVLFIERIGNFECNFQCRAKCQRSTKQAIGKGLAIEELHYEEISAILRADIVRRTNVGVSDEMVFASRSSRCLRSRFAERWAGMILIATSRPSRVLSALTKTLELDPANVSARLAFARLLMQFEYDWAPAEREYQRAIEVSPNSADAHFQYSEYLRKVDRRTEGDKEFDLAQSLNPAHDYFAEPS